MTKRLSLAEAASLVSDQSTLALGGLSLYRRPVAFVRSLLSCPYPRDLTLLTFTAGYESDLLLGAGRVSRVRTVYFGLETFGLAPRFTTLARSGDIEVMQETEASIVMGLRAAVSGVGFMPSTAWQGTDLLALRADVLSLPDPYTGKQLTAFPAIPVDVAVLHALEADAAGNVAINNNLAVDQLLVYAASTVIVTTEAYVDAIAPAPHKTIIPARGVDYVALAPRGAHPTSCYPLYRLDGSELMRYSEEAASAEGFAAYLQAISD